MAHHSIRKRVGSLPRKVGRAEKAATEKVVKALELPSDFIAGMTHLEFSGNREVVVEGCRGVLEYDENIIRLSVGKMKLRFLGRGLEIRNFTEHSATIFGYISSVEFLD